MGPLAVRERLRNTCHRCADACATQNGSYERVASGLCGNDAFQQLDLKGVVRGNRNINVPHDDDF